MGSGIAAHLANSGIPVTMLDLGDAAVSARRRLRVRDPAPLFLPEVDGLISPGSLERDLSAVADAGWVIEAVVEDLAVKRALLDRVVPHRRPGTIVTTNTSGLPIRQMAEGLPDEFRGHFLGAHFFNPPRHMRLLEVIPTPETDPAVTEKVSAWGDRHLGKGVVVARDTPGFIANRIGTYTFLRSVALMLEHRLTVEEVDALTGPLVGRPRSATFRTSDLVGLDVALAVANCLYAALPRDESRDTFRVPEVLREMAGRGWLGEKSGAGFYRRAGSETEVLDLTALAYRPRRSPSAVWVDEAMRLDDAAGRLRSIFTRGGPAPASDPGRAFLRVLLRDVLLYAARRVPEISDDILNIDRAMRWGFGWALGPFEVWDAVGVEAVAAAAEEPPTAIPTLVEQAARGGGFYRREDGHTLFFDVARARHAALPIPPGVLVLGELKRTGRVVASNSAATLIDLGEGAACVEFHAKANTIRAGTLRMLTQALDRLERDFDALIIGNQAPDFSAGANLVPLLSEAEAGRWEALDRAVREFQAITRRIRSAPRPVVGAPAGRTLGGGAELCLACAGLQAAAETYMGLVETGVGLIPAGGGTTEMVRRTQARVPADVTADMLPLLRWTFEMIARATVSRSAADARRLGYLDPRDGITMNPARQVYDAREAALARARAGYRPPIPERIRVLGARGRPAWTRSCTS